MSEGPKRKNSTAFTISFELKDPQNDELLQIEVSPLTFVSISGSYIYDLYSDGVESLVGGFALCRPICEQSVDRKCLWSMV